MQTFDTDVRASSLRWAVLAPPLLFWGLVQLFAWQAGDGVMSAGRVAILIGLAQALPLAALGWMLTSVAAYSVGRGRVIEHRVVRDREFVLGPETELAAREDGSITVRWPTGRSLRLRVRDSLGCFERLREARAERG